MKELLIRFGYSFINRECLNPFSQRMTLPWKNYIEKIQEDAAETRDLYNKVIISYNLNLKSTETSTKWRKYIEEDLKNRALLTLIQA